MNHIDILDNEIAINGNILTFPMSYAEVKSVFGDARIEKDKRNWKWRMLVHMSAARMTSQTMRVIGS